MFVLSFPLLAASFVLLLLASVVISYNRNETRFFLPVRGRCAAPLLLCSDLLCSALLICSAAPCFDSQLIPTLARVVFPLLTALLILLRASVALASVLVSPNVVLPSRCFCCSTPLRPDLTP